MKKIYSAAGAVLAVAAVFLSVTPLRLQAALEIEAGPLAELVREAYQTSPTLRAAHARWQAAVERAPQAASLPDPTVAYGYFVERMNTRQQFRVEQMFPGWGKRHLRSAVAQAEAEAAAIALETTAANVRLEIVEAAINYSLTLESTTRTTEALQLTESLMEVAGQSYRTGGNSQIDLLLIEAEVESLRSELIGWRERETSDRAWVNAIIGRPAETPLPGLEELPALGAMPDVRPDELRQQLLHNPDLREAQAQIRVAEQAHKLARSQSRPDLMLGVEYMDNRDNAPDEVMGMVSINLPLWRGKYRAERREAAANLRAAQSNYTSRLNQTESEIWRALYAARDAHRRAQLYTDSLVPRATQTLSLVEADYQTGLATFKDLLDAQRALLDLELDRAQAQADAFLRTAQWERLIATHPDLFNALSSTAAQ